MLPVYSCCQEASITPRELKKITVEDIQQQLLWHGPRGHQEVTCPLTVLQILKTSAVANRVFTTAKAVRLFQFWTSLLYAQNFAVTATRLYFDSQEECFIRAMETLNRF